MPENPFTGPQDYEPPKNTEKFIKKVTTTYASSQKSKRAVLITVNEKFDKHISVHDWGEPCSGILKHWGTPKELIAELEEIIEAIKSLPANN